MEHSIESLAKIGYIAVAASCRVRYAAIKKADAARVAIDDKGEIKSEVVEKIAAPIDIMASVCLTSGFLRSFIQVLRSIRSIHSISYSANRFNDRGRCWAIADLFANTFYIDRQGIIVNIVARDIPYFLEKSLACKQPSLI